MKFNEPDLVKLRAEIQAKEGVIYDEFTLIHHKIVEEED